MKGASMNIRLRFILLLCPAILCMCGIFLLSAQTAEQSSQTSGTVIHEILLKISDEYVNISPAEQKNIIDSLQFFIRKGTHFSIYALLAALFFLSFSQSSFRLKTKYFLSFLCTVLYAISDEIHQTFVPGRSGELRDVLIDSCGALTALLLVYLCVSIYKFIRKKCG
jgi:VanZ family protein